MLSYWTVSAVCGVCEEMLSHSYVWKIVMLVILLGMYSHSQPVNNNNFEHDSNLQSRLTPSILHSKNSEFEKHHLGNNIEKEKIDTRKCSLTKSDSFNSHFPRRRKRHVHEQQPLVRRSTISKEILSHRKSQSGRDRRPFSASPVKKRETVCLMKCQERSILVEQNRQIQFSNKSSL